MANQNIILKKTGTSLANNEIQILRDHTTGLEIKATAMIARTKQGQLKSAIASKDKTILATPIENIEC